MAKKKKKKDTSAPESRIDRISRDLNRTFLHGARARTNGNLYKPAAIVTGQQFRVDVPSDGPMNFEFQLGGNTRTVTVQHADAAQSEKIMNGALAKPEKYLTLAVDTNVPTWVFHQREFTLPDRPTPEEFVKLVGQNVLSLPGMALHEVQRVGRTCDVSLWRYNGDSQKGKVLPTNWQPAILLRFGLRTPKDKIRVKDLAEGLILELEGTRQGDRYYLDQLGLLPGNRISNPQEISAVSFLLEEKPGVAPEPVTTWTLVRTNLTEEARSNKFTELRTEPNLPFLATQDGPEDGLRLLQMASITNSGGYFLRVPTSKIPKTLVVCVLLKPEKATHYDSVPIPRAANAVAYQDGSPVPNVARFEENENVQIAPFVPPGFVAFAWTRSEPTDKSSDEDKFGYGTISLVDYNAVDGAGTIWENANSGVAISPLRELPGDLLREATTQQIQDERGRSLRLTSGSIAAMRLLAPHHLEARIANKPEAHKDDSSITRYYRASICCYHKDSDESPYAPLSNVARRMITIAPGFRDVFGNRFETNAATIQRKLFYTDAVIAPAEWPGFRFSVYPDQVAGDPTLSLEISYTPLPGTAQKTDGSVAVTHGSATVTGKGTAFAATDIGRFLRVSADTDGYRITNVAGQVLTLSTSYSGITAANASYAVIPNQIDRTSRYLRLIEILHQLNGANSDVQMTLNAAPLLQNTVSLTAEVSKWLKETIIPLENPTLVRGDIKLPPRTLGPYRCDKTSINIPELFQPSITIKRDGGLCPQPTDLPKEPVLRKVISEQVAQASSPVLLAENASPSLFLRDETRKDEFRNVAHAFQKHIASFYTVQVGFLRNQFNQHELWLIPDGLFPTVPADASKQSAWTFATARPLSNKLGTDEFKVPDFTKTMPVLPETEYWKGYPLQKQHFVEQDFDELGRNAFRLIEREAFKPEVVTVAKNAALIKTALQTKDAIARRLASWEDSPTYLIPVFAKPSTFDPSAINRLAKDAFLRNLNAFYNLDTFIQLPLERLGDQTYLAMFQGKVVNPFPLPPKPKADDPAIRLPAFSDILLTGGEKKVTVLYDVPPGTDDPNLSTKVPPIPPAPGALKAQITHVQRKLEDASTASETTAFNEGPWLELAVPKELAWYGTGKCVPVAIRRFPTKPTGVSATVLPLNAPSGGGLRAKDVPLLIKWGWRVSFCVEGLSTDTVHATIRYNEADTEGSRVSGALVSDWEPISLLHCLVVLKRLSDHWGTIAEEDRLPLILSLLVSLEKFLRNQPVSIKSVADQPRDYLDIRFSEETGSPIVEHESYKVMGGKVDLSAQVIGKLKQITLTALAELSGNKAFLIAAKVNGESGPVHNFRPSFKLTRNEKIGIEPLDPRLIYECAAVETPREYWASNSWIPPYVVSLKYELEPGRTLLDGLKQFFGALFNGASLNTFAVEVSAALQARREGLSVQTAFSLVPSDLMPLRGDAADSLATLVFNKSKDLLGEQGAGDIAAPAEMDESSLRLHIKISKLKEGALNRTLLEIGAIDFPLVSTKTKRRNTSRHLTQRGIKRTSSGGKRSRNIQRDE